MLRVRTRFFRPLHPGSLLAIATLSFLAAGYASAAVLESLFLTPYAWVDQSDPYGGMDVAVADLIPSLHRRPEPLETVRQFALIALGVGVIALAHALLEH